MIEVSFFGRLIGSIGVVSYQTDIVVNDPRIDLEACRVELSSRYQDIFGIEVIVRK